MKYYYLSSYMLKPSFLLSTYFKENNMTQEEILKHMLSVSSYIDVDTSKDQYRLLNPNPFNCITGYMIEYDVRDKYLKRLTQKRLNLIDGSI